MSEPTGSGTDIATWSSSADQHLSIRAHEQRQGDWMFRRRCKSRIITTASSLTTVIPPPPIGRASAEGRRQARRSEPQARRTPIS